MREKTKAHRETEAPQELERQLSRGQAAIAYLQENQGKSPFSGACTYLGDGVEMAIKDFSLYHIQELTFEEKAPRREAMENILGTFRGMKGIHFLYLILGDENKVKFYFGVARDYSYDAPPDFSALDVGRDILLPGIRGNFRGSAIAEVSENEEKAKILETLRTFSEGGCLFGVPGSDADSESFQGVDRLIDVMAGDRFGFLLLARPYAEAQVDEIETALMEASDALTPLAHYSVQRSHSKNVAVHEGRSITHARQGGRSTQKSDTQSASSTENQSYDRRQDVSNQTQSSTNRTGVENFGQDRNYHSSHAETENPSSRYSDTKTEGWGNSTNESHSVQDQIMDAASYSASSSETTGQAASTSQGDSHTLQRSVSQTVSKNRNREESEATNDSDTRTEQVEVAAKRAAEWLKYIDEVLLPRLDHGRGKGLFLACAYLFSEEPTVLGRLANTAISLYSGPKGNRAALAFHPFPKEEAGGRTAMQNMQIPAVWGKTSKALLWAAALSLDMGGERRFGGSWLSAEELGIFAALPQKEVPGLALREEVDFGLNMNLNAEPIPEEERIPLGRLVQNGIPRGLTVDLDKRVLNKHIFITGVTGSGKTTTCQHILRSWSSGAHPRPFLVIEPAKTEYRMMRDADVLFFTLGQQDVAPFFLNPFELFPGEKITARADMLKATFTAAFEMEAAIPQILETSIYRAYEAKGWDIRTNRWQRKGEEETDGPFADGMNAFPTMADFLQAIEAVTKEKKFGERLESEYLGSLIARVESLTVGAKGMILNTPRSLDFGDLIGRRVVIELEEIKSGAEKTLFMGFILTNLLQAIKARYYEDHSFRHITLVEEAHRLLSRYEPGDNLNKKQGVGVFADMLAEVRKYGESLIIADQIPEKMTPEVLKNTNTKIVHKLFARDDKESIGDTMALDDDQKAFLSKLPTGRAVVMTQGWSRAVQVEVEKPSAAHTEQELTPTALRSIAARYYAEEKVWRRGVLLGADRVSLPPDEAIAETYLWLLLNGGEAVRQYRAMAMSAEMMSEDAFQGFVGEVKYLRRTAADALLLPFLYCHAYREKPYDAERYEVYRILLQDVLEEKANRENFFSKIQKYLRLRRV